MAETLISPGVLARENDSSQITSQPVQAGAAIVGPTVKGNVNIPTLVTTYSEYLANFGSTFTSGSDEYSFLTSISAYNYFQNGGTSLLVTKVASGSFSAATSSIIAASASTDNAFTLKTLGEGEIMNSTSTEGTNGSLPSGTTDNVRWEIVNPDLANGVFSVLIRRGDDTNQNKVVLETFTNVSLDPKAPNYVARVIGDQTQTVQGSGTDVYLQTTGNYPNGSRFVRVSSVTQKTPDYFDNNGVAKNAFTSSIPTAQSGTFGAATGDILTGTGKYYSDISATDSQGLKGANYTTALNLLANKDDYRYNLITAPGLIYENADQKTPLNTLI